MSFQTIAVQLAAAVATSGTFNVNYPTGYTKGDFVFGQQHKIVTAGNDVYSAPVDFTVALNASNVTVTWKNATTLAINTNLQLQLDQVGSNYQSTRVLQDGTSKPVPGFATYGAIEYWSLGTPAAAAATAILNAVAATGNAGVTQAVAVTLDVPRNAVAVSSNAGDTTQTVTFFGKDINGKTMSEAKVLNGTTPVVFSKAFYQFTGYAYSANLAGNLSIGTGTKLGLPAFLANSVFVLKEIQDGASATAGTFVAGDASTAATTTGDVRGTYVPNTAPDGTKSYAIIVAALDFGYQGAPQA